MNNPKEGCYNCEHATAGLLFYYCENAIVGTNSEADLHRRDFSCSFWKLKELPVENNPQGVYPVWDD